MSLHAAAGGHCQGEHGVQHLAGLQRYLGCSAVCSVWGGKLSVKGLLHLPGHGAEQPNDHRLLRVRTVTSHRIIEPFGLEETLDIVKSNC